MEISNEAEVKIRAAIQKDVSKFPRIVLKKGGCAGHMLVLLLELPADSDEFIESHGIKFAVAHDALEYVNDISIELRKGLGEEVLLRNINAPACRCGKSFKK